MTKRSPFRYVKTPPEIIPLAAMMNVQFPLSLRNVEDLLHERGIDVSNEAVPYWWHRFGPMIAAVIPRKYVHKYGIMINQCVTDVAQIRPQLCFLRHLPLRNVSPDPAAAEFFRYIQGLCGRGCSPASTPESPEAFSLRRYSLNLLPAPIR